VTKNSGDLVLCDWPEAGIAVLTLNRPRARNALSRALVAELHEWASCLAEDDGLRAVVITGVGDRAFCAGADLIERQTVTAAERTAHTEAISAAVEAMAALPVPVIGAIRGFALAGGAELALACDLRIGDPSTVMGFPEVKIGIFPGAGGVVRLPRLIGVSAANDLLFTGRQVGADEASRLGLLDYVVASGSTLERALAKAREIAANAPLAIRAVKAALRESAGLPVDQANEVVGRHRRPLDATADYQEGLAAFAEKRIPRFTGR
jgi:enoyl-CoA hydratase/carnithine racemase